MAYFWQYHVFFTLCRTLWIYDVVFENMTYILILGVLTPILVGMLHLDKNFDPSAEKNF